MPRKRLQQILDDLQTEVHSGSELSDTDRQSLRDLVSDLRDVLHEETRSDDSSILSDLNDATVRFESSHPTLTRTLTTISDLLRSIGIS
jgi:hypothetical protein